VDMGKSKNNLKVFLYDSKQKYKFMEIQQTDDGSVCCFLSHIPKNKKNLAQTIMLDTNNKGNTIITESRMYKFEDVNTYITYHTTGRVNYHGFSFAPMYMEPLYNITQPNPFFIISFQQLNEFVVVSDNELNTKSNVCVLDVSALRQRRINIVLSIIPYKFDDLNLLANQVRFEYNNMFSLLMEIFDDKQSFDFSNIYEPNDCIKMRPHVDRFSKQICTQNEAYLKYQHQLYNQEGIIILSPNLAGIVKVIFAVEMRRLPWIKIEFENRDIEIRAVNRKTTSISFKLFNKKTSRYIYDAKEVKITSLILDAEIYEDEMRPPEGFI